MLKDIAGTRKPMLGGFIKSNSPWLVEVLGALGFDLVIIDTEHGMIGLRECEELVRAADAKQIPALVRVPSAESMDILRLAETGPSGIMVPNVRSAAGVRVASDAVRFHPLGQRGVGRSRAAAYGAKGSIGDYMAAVNAEMTVSAIIEDPEGVERAEEIAAAPELDMVLTGSVDMSASLGLPGQVDHPQVLDANQKIVAAAKNAGKLVGGLATTVAAIQEMVQEATLDLICVPTESLIVQHLKEVRQLIPLPNA